MTVGTNKLYIYSAYVICAFVLTGCGEPDSGYSVPLNPCGWESGDAKSIVINNSDTVRLRELSVFVVTGNGWKYPCNELALEITTRTPGSVTFSERFPFMITGGGNGAVCSGTYRSDVRFAEKGEYEFIVRHQQKDPVSGLRALGIEITETEDGKK